MYLFRALNDIRNLSIDSKRIVKLPRSLVVSTGCCVFGLEVEFLRIIESNEVRLDGNKSMYLQPIAIQCDQYGRKLL